MHRNITTTGQVYIEKLRFVLIPSVDEYFQPIDLNLFRQEFRRGEARFFLENPVEVVCVSEAQQMGRFADIVPMHQEAFTPFNYERMDVADCCTACSLVDQVAQIAGRIRQF